jgi:hypothetical protein
LWFNKTIEQLFLPETLDVGPGEIVASTLLAIRTVDQLRHHPFGADPAGPAGVSW